MKKTEKTKLEQLMDFLREELHEPKNAPLLRNSEMLVDTMSNLTKKEKKFMAENPWTVREKNALAREKAKLEEAKQALWNLDVEQAIDKFIEYLELCYGEQPVKTWAIRYYIGLDPFAPYTNGQEVAETLLNTRKD